MRYCCQLIPLQITPPFIVSSRSLTRSLFLRRSQRSLSLAPTRLSTPIPPRSTAMLVLLSRSCASVTNSSPSLRFSLPFSFSSSLLHTSLCILLSLSLSFPLSLKPRRSLSYFSLAPLLFRSLFYATYPSTFLVLSLSLFLYLFLTVLSRDVGLFSATKECIWDRRDKRNCANKYAPADNCSINRLWLKG